MAWGQVAFDVSEPDFEKVDSENLIGEMATTFQTRIDSIVKIANEFESRSDRFEFRKFLFKGSLIFGTLVTTLSGLFNFNTITVFLQL
jgi:hypothetical protein